MSNVTADNLRISWEGWFPSVDDAFATLISTPLTHAKFYNTKHLVVVSLNMTLSFGSNTPSPHSLVSFKLPSNIRIKSGTEFKNQCVVERSTSTNERKFSFGFLIADGLSKGGVDGETFLNLDKIFVSNLGQFIAGQTYTVNGQIVFEPT